MKTFISTVVSALALTSIMAAPSQAASFDCQELDNKNAAERSICMSRGLSALDERLDSWYRRALLRAKYFGQTREVRADQRAWLTSRNACGYSHWCLRRQYVKRLRELRNYVEHV